MRTGLALKVTGDACGFEARRKFEVRGEGVEP